MFNLKTTFRTYFDLTIAMFIAGSSVVASKLLVQTLPIFLASEYSLIIASIILSLLTFINKKQIPQINAKTLFILFVQAFTGVFLFRTFLFFGLKLTSAVESGLITSISPAILGLLAFFFLKEELSTNKVIGITLVVLGLLIFNVLGYSDLSTGSTIKGNLLILIAVFCEASFSILNKLTNNIPTMYRATIINIFATICFIPFSIYDFYNYDFTKINYVSFLSVLYYGTFISVISFILWFRAIEKVSASSVAVFSGVMPISSMLLSSLILKEKISYFHIISLILIIMGICASCLKIKKTAFNKQFNYKL